MKRCSKCAVTKPLSDFPRHRRMPMGVYSCCKACKATEAANSHVKHRQANIDRCISWRQDNPTRKAQHWQGWYAENRAAVLKRKRERLDPARNAHYAGIRRARRSSAIPPWANLEAIQAFYRLARKLTRETGEPWTVDHEIPLKHPLVSGLHVENNLRVVPYAVNAKKGNRFTPEAFK